MKKTFLVILAIVSIKMASAQVTNTILHEIDTSYRSEEATGKYMNDLQFVIEEFVIDTSYSEWITVVEYPCGHWWKELELNALTGLQSVLGRTCMKCWTTQVRVRKINFK